MVSFPQVSPPKPYIHLSPISARSPVNLILLYLFTRLTKSCKGFNYKEIEGMRQFSLSILFKYISHRFLYSILHRRQTSAGHLGDPVLHPVSRYTGHMLDRLQLHVSISRLHCDTTDVWPPFLSQETRIRVFVDVTLWWPSSSRRFARFFCSCPTLQLAMILQNGNSNFPKTVASCFGRRGCSATAL